MLEQYADAYIRLGAEMHRVRMIVERRGDTADLVATLRELKSVGHDLELPKPTGEMIDAAIADPPQSMRELDMLFLGLVGALKAKTFFYIPTNRFGYYKAEVPEKVMLNFPTASRELVAAGNCIACELYTAAVFHAMRAVEIGVRALAVEIKVKLPNPVELSTLGGIAKGIDTKLLELKNKRKTTKRDADLKFFSEAAVQFRYFNNGWRIRVSHARENYAEDDAKEVITHVRSFFVTLAQHLAEPEMRVP